MSETPAPPAPEAAPAPPPPKEQPKPKEQKAKPDTPAGEKKLSGAELKKKAKEEKAARRAQEKTARGGAPAPQAQAQQQSQKGKPKKQEGGPQLQGTNLPVRSATLDQQPKEVKLLPETLAHLSLAKRPGITETDRDVQTPILMLGQYMAAFDPQCRDSTERLVLTLKALKKVYPTTVPP